MPAMHIGKRRLGSHNALLKTFPGADGLKTGFTCDSGYNVIASATRDGRPPDGGRSRRDLWKRTRHSLPQACWNTASRTTTGSNSSTPTISTTLPMDPNRQGYHLGTRQRRGLGLRRPPAPHCRRQAQIEEQGCKERTEEWRRCRRWTIALKGPDAEGAAEDAPGAPPQAADPNATRPPALRLRPHRSPRKRPRLRPTN